MIHPVSGETIPQITRVSADTIVVAPHPENHPVARIIAANWDEPGQSITKRPIVVTAIRDRYGNIEWLSIRVDGTPERGHVIVGLTNPDLAVRIRLSPAKSKATAILNAFARKIVAAAWGQGGGE
jgi:hypothetical protein